MHASPMLRTDFHQVPSFQPAHASSSVPGICIAMRAGSLIPIDLTQSDFLRKQSGRIHPIAISPSVPGDVGASENHLQNWKVC